MELYVIHVTKKCNMDCMYCYEKDKTSTYTWEEIKLLIDNIIKYNKDKEAIFEFLGGEPMLAFDLIKQSVEYVESIKGFHVPYYIITTNGTIVSKEIIEWLLKNPKVFPSISIDGTKHADQLRMYKDGKSSHNDVIINIKTLIRNIGSDRVLTHIVTHPWNVYLLDRSINYLYSIGVRNIGIGMIESTWQITKEYADTLIQEMHKISCQRKDGFLTDVHIDLIDNLKPPSDKRIYIKDPETGKTLGETYGRTEDDMTSNSDQYNSISTSSDMHNTLLALRRQIYDNHIRNMGWEK